MKQNLGILLVISLILGHTSVEAWTIFVNNKHFDTINIEIKKANGDSVFHEAKPGKTEFSGIYTINEFALQWIPFKDSGLGVGPILKKKFTPKGFNKYDFIISKIYTFKKIQSVYPDSQKNGRSL